MAYYFSICWKVQTILPCYFLDDSSRWLSFIMTVFVPFNDSLWWLFDESFQGLSLWWLSCWWLSLQWLSSLMTFLSDVSPLWWPSSLMTFLFPLLFDDSPLRWLSSLMTLLFDDSYFWWLSSMMTHLSDDSLDAYFHLQIQWLGICNDSCCYFLMTTIW